MTIATWTSAGCLSAILHDRAQAYAVEARAQGKAADAAAAAAHAHAEETERKSDEAARECELHKQEVRPCQIAHAQSQRILSAWLITSRLSSLVFCPLSGRLQACQA